MKLPRLRDCREDMDKTQNDIAQILKITKQQYQLYESGKRTIPIDYLITLAKFYNVSIDYLAGLIPTPRPLDDKPGKTITRLTPKQMLLLQKYQENPDLQKAIDRILMIQ